MQQHGVWHQHVMPPKTPAHVEIKNFMESILENPPLKKGLGCKTEYKESPVGKPKCFFFSFCIGFPKLANHEMIYLTNDCTEFFIHNMSDIKYIIHAWAGP